MSPWKICRPVTTQSTDYWLTVLIFTTEGCELWIYVGMHMCRPLSFSMCVYEYAVCICMWAQPELTVKWRTGNINWGCCANRLHVHQNTFSVTYEPDFLLGCKYKFHSLQVGELYFVFAEATAAETYLVFRFPSELEGGETVFAHNNLVILIKLPYLKVFHLLNKQIYGWKKSRRGIIKMSLSCTVSL